ncbi:hypothetical protein IW261DRAFT_1426221 [Armillaria novae-zelandiae]|uniref:Uncharacterized protein n=1 Tax=Armillaria novae-zelandiae TaxID=153914 RepID=A0AA39NN60_9AGAR|nr:hypothetical protein IW261DRAFT_1426221 [Armillaria novae-zelandiae]
MSLNVELIPVQDIPFEDYYNNLMWAHTVAACYFETAARRAAPTGEVINSVEKAHIYLDAHMYILEQFELADSQYGLALRSAISLLVARIPTNLHCHEWSNPKQPQVLPHHGTTRPKPRMIHTPEPPKELSFSTPGKKLIGVMLPLIGSTLGGPNMHKCQQDQEAIMDAPLPVWNVQYESSLGPSLSTPPAPKAGSLAALKAVLPASKSIPGAMHFKGRACKAFKKSLAPKTVQPLPTTKKPVFCELIFPFSISFSHWLFAPP